MRRITVAFVAGFTVAVCCILWIIQRSRSKSAPPHPSPIPVPPPVPSPPSPSPPPPVSVEEADKPSPSITLGIGIFLVFGVILLFIFGRDTLFLPSAPEYGGLALPVPIVPDPTSTQGVSTVPAGYLIGSASPREHGILTFHMSQIKNDTPTTATLSGTMSLAVPSDLQAAICDESIALKNIFPGKKSDCSVATKQSACVLLKGKQVFPSVYILKQEYASEMLTLTVKNHLSTSPLFSTTLPLGDIFSMPSALTLGPACGSPDEVPDPVQTTFPLTVTLPLNSQGLAYPDDWYAASLDVLLTLPFPLYIPDQYIPTSNLPIDLRVAANTNMSDFTLQMVQGTNNLGFAFGASRLTLLATRNSLSRVFAYISIGIFPLIFSLIFLWTLFPRRFFSSKRRGKAPQRLTTTLYNILMLVLSLVFLRPILVPADLQGGVTRVDFWLVFGGIIPLAIFLTRCLAPTRWVR